MKNLKKSLVLTVIVLLLFVANVCAAVPHLINYQGQLTDKDSKPLDGTYALTFKVYDAESGGNLLSEELFSSMRVEKGVFSVLLGSGTAQASLPLIGALPFDKPYFLEIKVGDEIIAPRQRITSTGYALKAEKAEIADSVKAGSIDRSALSSDVSASLMPAGTIVMWHGTIATIPTGWVLCDGSNGTPDLRNRFIVAADADDSGVAKSTVTGEALQTSDGVISEHKHYLFTSYTYPAGYSTNWGSSHTSRYGGSSESAVYTSNAGTGTKNIAVFYALVFIMKQ